MDYGEISERHQNAQHHADRHRDVLYEIYRYFHPHRVVEIGEDPNFAPGLMWDGLPATLADEAASRLQAGLAPLFQIWLRLSLPPSMDAAQRRAIEPQLERVNTQLWSDMSRNFGERFGAFLADMLDGNGVMLVEDGGLDSPFKFEVEPMLNMSIETDGAGQDTGFFRRRERTVQQVQQVYGWTPPEKVYGSRPDHKLTVIDAALRAKTDREERWKVITWIGEKLDPNEPVIVQEREDAGAGSCPWIVGKWDPSPSSPWAIGPLYRSLPLARQLCHFFEKGNKAADIATSGMWSVEDDGVLNTDMIRLEPGEFIPRAPGSRPPEPLQNSYRFDIWELMISRLEQRLIRALFLDRLGPAEGTPMSATEVLERRAELARVINGPYNRITALMDKLVRRLLFVKKGKEGYELPQINGRDVEIDMLGPFARDQRLEEALSAVQFAQMLQGTFGPELMPAVIDQFGLARWLGERMDFPEHLVRDPEQNRDAINAAVDLVQRLGAGQGATGGGAPPVAG